jgi:MFS family permease
LSESAKWRTLFFISLAEFLAMAVWFSASAVVPMLTAAWGLSESQRAWLTMSVQVGFVLGTLASSLLNLADRLEARAGWSWAFAFLAIGPACGIVSMLALHRHPAAVRMANGRF